MHGDDDDGGQTAFAREKSETESRDGQSRKTSIAEFLERKYGFK